MRIDTSFNFQQEMGDPNKDADKYSRMLQTYHQTLWSKLLPNGNKFELEKLSGSCLLRYTTGQNNLLLSSDRAVATFAKWKRLEHIIVQIPPSELEEFVNLTDTIGGILIWPSSQVDGMSTINAERGFNRLICDRLDITIECIRLYYDGQNSPLLETFKRYKSFFDLFVNFQGYIDFFLLQDYVTDDCKSVFIAPPYNGFKSAPIPKTVDEYSEYMNQTIKIIRARNSRINYYLS